MKVLHIITGLGNGGAEAVLYNLCRYDKSNTHVVISLMDEGKYGSLLRESGISVSCLHQKPGFFSPIKFKKLVDEIRKNKPDAIQTWMYHGNFIGGLAGYVARCRNIVWGIHHTKLDLKFSPISTYVVYWLSVLVSRMLPKSIIFCGQRSLKNHISDCYPSNKSVFVPNGYDLEKFYPDDISGNRLRNDLGINNDAFLIGMVGRYNPQKDHPNLISALSILDKKNIKYICILIGVGLDRSNAEIVNMIKINGLTEKVKLLGPQDNIPDFMRAVDIHVLSSMDEAFPNVINEAMASGSPCVTTDVGDAAYIVGNTGWVAPPKNPELLAERIIDALDEFNGHELFQQRRKRARERIVDNFSIQKMVENYNRVWRMK